MPYEPSVRLPQRSCDRMMPGGPLLLAAALFTLGRYLAHYWPDGPEQDLLPSGKFRVRETVYDWSLNGVGTGRPKR